MAGEGDEAQGDMTMAILHTSSDTENLISGSNTDFECLLFPLSQSQLDKFSSIIYSVPRGKTFLEMYGL